MTRQGFGLDRFVQREFPAETTVEAAEPAMRPRFKIFAYGTGVRFKTRYAQEIRTYYDFPDIDIDRYEIDGKMRR